MCPGARRDSSGATTRIRYRKAMLHLRRPAARTPSSRLANAGSPADRSRLGRHRNTRDRACGRRCAISAAAVETHSGTENCCLGTGLSFRERRGRVRVTIPSARRLDQARRSGGWGGKKTNLPPPTHQPVPPPTAAGHLPPPRREGGPPKSLAPPPHPPTHPPTTPPPAPPP